jgi:ABC-2 type transport system permease protein
VAGLNPSDAAQFHALFKLRRVLSFRRFKGRPQEAAVTIVFLVLALPLPFLLAFATTLAYNRLPAPWDAELLGVVLTLLWMTWLLVPILGASFNETPDLARLLLFPVRRRVLIEATFAGSIFDYSTLFSFPFLVAALFCWLGGSATIITPLALLLAAAHLLVAGQLVETVLGGVARSRRMRDLATLLGGLLGIGVWWLQVSSDGFARAMRDLASRAMEARVYPLEVLQWTPPGACARAIERASGGETGSAVLWLSGAALTLAGLTWLWWMALDRVTTRGEFALAGRSRARKAHDTHARTEARARARYFKPTVLAMAATDLRLMWRSPQRRLQMLQGALMPLFFGALSFGRSRPPDALIAMVPTIFVSLLGTYAFQNVIAQDGKGVATIFLSPLDRSDMFRGKVLAFSVVAAVPLAIICTIAAVLLPSWLAVSGTLMAVGAFLVSTGVSCGVSARFAVRQPEDGKRAKTGGATVPGLMFGLVQPIMMSALFGPVWIPVLVAVLTRRPAMALIVSSAGVLYGWFVFRFAMKSAGKALVAREPEMIQTLELGRVS